jgi:DNA-binding IclR family transcriptional regulator
MGRDNSNIKSDETLFGIIGAIQELDEATLTNIAEQTGVSKSTAHRHLATMRDHEYVVKSGNTYQLGLKFLDIGGHVRKQLPHYTALKSLVKQLAKETGEYVGFVIEQAGVGVYVYSEKGSKAVGNFARVGRRTHLHQITKGRVILAHLPEDRVQEIVDTHGLPPRTQHTITDAERLFKDLKAIRYQGYACSKGGHTDGLWSVSVPVHGKDGEVLGGLGIAAPPHRMRGERFQKEIPELLEGEVRAFELDMSYA